MRETELSDARRRVLEAETALEKAISVLREAERRDADAKKLYFEYTEGGDNFDEELLLDM